MFNEVIFLITEQEKTYDADGFETGANQIRNKCYASVKSTTYKEYYEASKKDEQVTDIFTVDERDYNLSMHKNESGKRIRPSLIEYDGILYRIVRRFRRATNATYTMELTCKEIE